MMLPMDPPFLDLFDKTRPSVYTHEDNEKLRIRAGNPELRGRFAYDESASARSFSMLMFADLMETYDDTKWDLAVESPTPPPYRIAASTVVGAGQGMIATRQVSKGELILRERAVVVSPGFEVDMTDHDASPHEGERIICDLLDHIDPVDKARFFALSNCKTAGAFKHKKVLGIIGTNGFQCFFPQSKFIPTYVGVFLDLSRCQHRYVSSLIIVLLHT